MKRFQLFLVGAFVAAGPLFAQSADADWHSEVAKVKELIQTNPAQASEEAAQLLKGKNKKNTDLLTAIGQAYLVKLVKRKLMPLLDKRLTANRLRYRCCKAI